MTEPEIGALTRTNRARTSKNALTIGTQNVPPREQGASAER